MDGVRPGEYMLTITDRLGCTFSDTIFFDQCCSLAIDCNLDKPIIECENTFPDPNDIFSTPGTSNDVLMEALQEVGIAIDAGQCGQLDVTIDDSFAMPTDCSNDTLTIFRNYIISDAENSLSCRQELKVSDAIPSTKDEEAQSLFISCEVDLQTRFDRWISDHGEMLYTVCSDSFVLSTIPTVPILDETCNASTEITFVVTDKCGDMLMSTAEFHVIDDAEPVVTCPNAILVIQTDEADPARIVEEWIATSTVTDNCTSLITPENDFVTDLSDLCSVPTPIAVSFTATDNCGNIGTCRQSIDIVDNTETVSCPSTLTIQCGDDNAMEYIAAWLEEAIASDNNNDLITNDFSGVLDNIGCNDPTEVEFSLPSLCAGPSMCRSSIIVVDEESPEITCPADLVVKFGEASFQQDIDSWRNAATAMDCNGVSISSDLELDLNDITCSEDFVAMFTAVDDCGLTSSCTSNLVVTNDSDLTISCPEGITMLCSDPDFASNALDLIDDVRVISELDYEMIGNTENVSLEPDCVELGIIEVGISAIDICGLERACVTTIEVITDPQIYVPNVFTPDNDGLNDWFTLYANESIEEITTLTIYDRWGSLIFETANIEPNDDRLGWDGRFQNELLGNGVYTYHAVLVDTSGGEIQKAGTIQVLR